ncbi:MAG: hypothetical protein M3R52_01815 [Acidobacteriota bacterium]|nr:hypothetical protein [Acidobacteriota bacterium]
MAESFIIFIAVVGSVVLIFVLVAAINEFFDVILGLLLLAIGIGLIIGGLTLLVRIGGALGAFGIFLALLGGLLSYGGVFFIQDTIQGRRKS